MRPTLSPFALIAVLSLAAAPAFAQIKPSADVDTVRSGIGEESLAPVPMKPQPDAGVNATVAVSATDVVAATDPMVVKGVVAVLSGTMGFDRDAALEIAARQALPGLLQTLGHTPDKAAKLVKSLGNAMRFVKSYKVVKETLIPTYTLTTDLTFNGPMVLKNFGGKMPEAVVSPTVIMNAGGTDVSGVEVEIPAGENVVVRQWVVRINDRDPANVDKVRVNLNKQAGTRATYRLLTSEGAELLVGSGLDAHALQAVAGNTAQVVELQVDLPTAVVPANGSHLWQGQNEPGMPGIPGVPNAPEGTY